MRAVPAFSQRIAREANSRRMRLFGKEKIKEAGNWGPGPEQDTWRRLALRKTLSQIHPPVLMTERNQGGERNV